MKTFRWFGGKGKMVQSLLSIVPRKIRLYCEPYCGSAALFFSRQRTCREILNDTDIWLINFYRVVQGKRYDELYHKLKNTPYALEEYLRAWRIIHHNLSNDEVDLAWAFFVIQNQGYAGHPAIVAHQGNWSRSSRGFTNNCETWNQKVKYLDTCRKRLKFASVMSIDALDCLTRFDDRNTFFYVDPPYPPDTVKGKKSYYQNPDIDHFINLRSIILDSSAAIMLSTYESSIWDNLQDYGWKKIAKKVHCHTVVWDKAVNSERTEVIWRNPRCLEMTLQGEMF